MKTLWIHITTTFSVFLCALGVAGEAWGATIHVSATSGNDANNGSTWALAKQTIQAGVDAAASGDSVLVTNGVYGAGGVTNYPPRTTLTNRLAIHKPIPVRSVHGPSVTFIQGAKDPLTINGPAAVRGVYLTNGAALVGFTIANGATRASGLSLDDDSGGGVWCQSTNAVISNCAFSGNSAMNSGGGAFNGALYHCAFFGNSADYGGGAFRGALYNCVLSGNSAMNSGGGAYRCDLYNCTLTDNSAINYGGGGASICTLYNCISYYNRAPNGANYDNSVFLYSCSTPQPDGTNNIAAAPLLLSASHLASNSPCARAGNAGYATGVDIDGNPWGVPPAMGCDEPTYPATGALTIAIGARWTNVVMNNATPFLRADIQGVPVSNRWTFGDGGALTNQAFDVGHAWASTGLYTVVAWAWNDSHPGGVSATARIHVVRGDFYVNVSNSTPTAPYDSWAKAATRIQDAVDQAPPGALILVSNGVYDVGGRPAPGGEVTNRVTIAEAMTVRSVNGPSVTLIRGAKDPLTTNGPAAVRGVYLNYGATLAGFTIANGATRSSLEPVDYSGGGVRCQSTNVVISNCVFSGNSAINYGGGVYCGSLYNCTLSDNSVVYKGGGVYYGALYNCALSGNSANSGGGAFGGALYNCALSGNSANSGGGASDSALYNCALTGNSAINSGGGVSSSTQYNCIVYYNHAPNRANYDNSVFLYSCSTPQPDGTNNIAAAPLLLSASHLASNSPCARAGSAGYATGVDIDGNPWGVPPAMGCDEPTYPATGALTIAIGARWTNVAVNNATPFLRADIQGVPVSNRWTFGDGGALTNQSFDVGHAWASTGLYTVVAWVWNDSHPGGVSATARIHVVRGDFYVNVSNSTPTAPYDSWAKAATHIQDAVDQAPPGALILVSNGVYDVGGRPAPGGEVTNRVTIAEAMTVRSVNGPSVTLIRGAKDPLTVNGPAAVRGVYLNYGATLAGFTIANGATRSSGEDCSGGGVWCLDTSATLSNCVIAGNSAIYGGGVHNGALRHCALTGNSASDGGGGARFGALYHCTLIGNSASYDGGGASDGALYNCALISNSADYGGGASGSALYNCTLTDNSADQQGGGSYHSALYNCIVYYNQASNGSNDYGSLLDHCATTPLPAGSGNMTNEPGFVNAAAGDYRLQSNSPCVNAGTNQSWMIGTMDLDGNSRISPAGGMVDIGAYEYPWGGSAIPSWWLEQYGLPTDGSRDYEDSDGDGFNNWQEWRCDTAPMNSNSFLKLHYSNCVSAASGIVIRWTSATSRTYVVNRSANLIVRPPFLKMATNIPGQPQITSYTDTTAAAAGPSLLYRVGVEE